MNANELIVVKEKFSDTDELLIVKESWFETAKVCDSYDRYGQKCGCYNAGCYALDNSGCSASSDMLECLYKHFDIEYSEDNLDYDHFESAQNGENELLENISQEDINSFIENWQEENENHSEHEAYTYWDGHNHRTVVLSTEFGESDLERINDDEEENEIIEEYLDREDGEQNAGYTFYKGKKYNFSESAFQESWAIASASLKDE